MSRLTTNTDPEKVEERIARCEEAAGMSGPAIYYRFTGYPSKPMFAIRHADGSADVAEMKLKPGAMEASRKAYAAEIAELAQQGYQVVFLTDYAPLIEQLEASGVSVIRSEVAA